MSKASKVRAALVAAKYIYAGERNPICGAMLLLDPELRPVLLAKLDELEAWRAAIRKQP